MATAKSQIENGNVDPKELAKVVKAVKSKEIAPSFSEQSGPFADFQKIRDQLGEPYDVFSIPLRKRRQMTGDPMIAFGLHYRKVPLARAAWHMDARDKDGPNAQVAAFMDSAWRIIHARYVLQHWQAYDYGYQALVERFIEQNPGGVYEDPSEENEENRIKPVWDEGSVNPTIWKPFVTLDPARVEPKFREDNGEFDGILYEIPPAARTKKTSFRSKAVAGNQNQRDIDVYRSLWVTNERDKVHGSIYGFPRTAYAYRYWWSYWYNWAQRDRGFERIAIPPLVAYHPEGNYRDPVSGVETPYQEIALVAAERLRANAIAAVPSTLQSSGIEERGTTQREWEFKFLETPSANLEHFHSAFNYLDVMKLRSIWVPEQAFIEGEGGTGSRNVAQQMGDIFEESLALDWDEMADHINRYVLPKILWINFPEFVNNGGTCRIIGHGFRKEDMEFVKQLIQLVGQADPLSLEVDIKEVLRRHEVPLLSPEQLRRQQERVAQQQTQPPAGVGGNGSVATELFNPGSTNGGSVPEPNALGTLTGFSDDEQSVIYVQPNEQIALSADSNFLAGLPGSKHYQDKAIKALAVQLRKAWSGHFRGTYSEFANWLENQSEEFALTDDEIESIELAERTSQTKAEKLAKKIINKFAPDSQRLKQVTQQSAKIINRIFKRSHKIEKALLNLDIEDDKEAIDEWLEAQTGKLIKRTHETIEGELQNFLVNAIRDDKDAKQIAKEVREHFSEFPGWKADRVARSEVRDAVNASTLFAAEGGELKYVRMTDGEEHDEHCKQRNGKLATIREAWKELNNEHPYGQLGFDPIQRANFSIEYESEFGEEAPEGVNAYFHDESSTVHILNGTDEEEVDGFLYALSERLIKHG